MLGVIPPSAAISGVDSNDFNGEFEKDGRELRVRVEGGLVSTNSTLRLNAGHAGLGSAYVLES